MSNRNLLYSTGLESGPIAKTLGNAANAASGAVGNVAEAAKSMAFSLVSSPGNMFQGGVQLLFFLSLAALFLFLFLVFIHYTITPVFSFMPGDSGYISIVPSGKKQTTLMKRPATATGANSFTDFYAFNTAFAFDLYVKTEFSTNVPRVLWYKAKAPVALGGSDSLTTLPGKFPESNLVFYMDAQKNDLMAMIQYNDVKAATPTVRQQHAVCAENVPLRKPVRIGVIIFERFVEIYMEGKLVRTIPGNGPLIAGEGQGLNIYGPPQFLNASVEIARLTYWPYIISPQIMRLDAAETRDPTIFRDV